MICFPHMAQIPFLYAQPGERKEKRKVQRELKPGSKRPKGRNGVAPLYPDNSSSAAGAASACTVCTCSRMGRTAAAPSIACSRAYSPQSFSPQTLQPVKERKKLMAEIHSTPTCGRGRGQEAAGGEDPRFTYQPCFWHLLSIYQRQPLSPVSSGLQGEQC